jgi:hypothetical protein
MTIRPWEWDLMTVEQEDRVLDWLDAYEEAQAKAAEKLKSGR